METSALAHGLPVIRGSVSVISSIMGHGIGRSVTLAATAKSTTRAAHDSQGKVVVVVVVESAQQGEKTLGLLG